MLGLLKKLFPSKYDKDIKALQPYVDATNVEWQKIRSLSNDDLRRRTLTFRQTIQEYLANFNADIAAAEQDAANTEDIFKKQDYFKEIDDLRKQRDKAVEEILIKILPQAFAVVKEASYRLANNEELEVTATDFDRELAAKGKDFLRIEGDKAYWKNTWTAAGGTIKWNMIHYDVQLIGGTALHQGKIAEMATGEGKTLVSTLPAYLNGLTGFGVHIVTVNNYLARRDAEWMGPLHQFLLLSVDCIDLYQPNSDERKKAYQSDIVYGTNNEFGFDYLRDNMVREAHERVQGKFHYAMVDEVDSVLVDDARTPLIISGPVAKDDNMELFIQLKPRVERLLEAQKQIVQDNFLAAKKLIAEGNTEVTEGGGALALFRAYRGLPKSRALIKYLSEPGMQTILRKAENHYMQEQSKRMVEADKILFFVIDEKQRHVELKDKGIELLTRSGEDPNLFVLPDLSTKLVEIDRQAISDKEKSEAKDKLMQEFNTKSELLHSIQQLLKAYTLFEKDEEYIIVDGQVKIVDEQTGRVMEGRRWSDGLHQAVEAKEGVKIEKPTQTYATVTLQNFFRMYHKLAGMTGTAETEAQELWEIYKLDVVVIPTNRPIVRKDMDDLVYKTEREKYNAVIEDIVKLREAGRPVLVGTTSVEKSELLSRLLKVRGIPHNVLNAKQNQREAEIVSEAGKTGQVTIATNMAGRGTDIKLGAGVKEAGGLAIIGTERHDSRRVDRQLRGRSGRQGDPGTTQFYVSLEDKLMRLFGSERIAGVMDRFGHKEGDVLQHSMVTSSIERAQKKVEENNFGVRKRLLDYDNVMNIQREAIYKMRNNALDGERLKIDMDEMMYSLCQDLVNKFKPSSNYEDFKLDVFVHFGIEPPFEANVFASSKADDLTDVLYSAVKKHYAARMDNLGQLLMPQIREIVGRPDNKYENIVFPLFDGRRGMDILVNLKKAIQTDGRAIGTAIEQSITLSVIDQLWKNHLLAMDELKDSVQSASFEQKDPLVIYKREAFTLFQEFIGEVNREIVSFLYRGGIPAPPPGQQNAPRQMRQAPAPQKPQYTSTSSDDDLESDSSDEPQAPQKFAPVRRDEPKIGRNDACPCGSGKKYKQCHGKNL